MRTKEQFKEFVYAKADAKRRANKRNNAVWLRGAMAFSLLFIISGVLIYGNFVNGNDAATESVLRNTIRGEGENDYGYYSKNEGLVEDGIALQSSIERYDLSVGSKGSVAYVCDNAEISSVSIDRECAIEIALERCTIEHDTTDVFYDEKEDIWKVVFYTSGTLGNCQTVYLNGNGTVRSIVYGE